MQIQLDIQFDQLLQIIRKLPLKQKNLLKKELDNESTVKTHSNLEQLLLSGPIATDEEIDRIENNRNALNQWRKSSLVLVYDEDALRLRL
jgi:hypothetical protein